MMKSAFWRRASIAGIVYAVVFVGLVFLQFSTVSGFSWRSGIVTLHAAPASNKALPPSSLDLSIGGLRMLVDGKHPARALLADGSSRVLGLSAVERAENGARLRFGSGVKLEIGLSGKTVNLLVTSSDPGVKFIELASPVPPSSSWVSGDVSATVSAQGKSWRVGLPASALTGTAVDFAVGSPVAIQSVVLPATDKTTYIAKSDVDYRQSILTWLDKAWSGLNASRFDSSAFRWTMADGSQAFSEQALAAWLAESFRRGQGEAALAKARQARELFAKSTSWLTVPYFGDTVAKMSELEASDAKAAKAFQAQVASKDPGILEARDLVPRLIDRSPMGLYASAIAFISGLDPAALSLRQQVGLLSAAASANSLIRGSTDALPNHVAAEAFVLSRMSQAGGAWFLKATDDGTVDVGLSLDAGIALVGLGKAEAKDNILAAGQSLVDGALSLSDGAGFIPATLALAASDIASRSGSIAPEALYAALADNPWYPHEVSFAKDLEAGVWAWTCSPSLTVEASSSKRVFSASFPSGSAHYLALYGIGKFAVIKLYGIDYSPDPQFESYNVSGYFYRSSIGALYLKMRHKTEIEKIELDY